MSNRRSLKRGTAFKTTDRMAAWLTPRLDAIWVDPAFTRRMDEAVNVGLPVVAVHATEPPPPGSPERDRWETSCDRCDADCFDAEMVSFTYLRDATRAADGAKMQVLLHGGVCASCAKYLGVDTVAAYVSPRGSAVEMVNGVRSKVGPGFQAMFGEAFEQTELVAERWDRRRAGE